MLVVRDEPLLDVLLEPVGKIVRDVLTVYILEPYSYPPAATLLSRRLRNDDRPSSILLDFGARAVDWRTTSP